MSTVVTCHCGQPLEVPVELAGDRIRCPACGASVMVPASSRALSGEAESPMVRFTCPCGQPCQAQIEHAGRKTKCPRCESILSIPFTDRVAPRVLEGPRADSSYSTERVSTRPAVSRDVDRDDDERPRDIRRRRPVKKPGGSRAWIFVVAGVILLALGGVILWRVLRNRIDSEFDLVPRDAQAFITVNVQEALKNRFVKELLDNLPIKTAIKEAEAKLGMKLEEVERLTIVLADLEKNIGWGLLHTSKDIDEDHIKAAMGGPQKKSHEGKTYFVQLFQGESVAVHLANPRLLVIGPEEGVKQCMSLPAEPKDEGPLVDSLKLASKGKTHVALGINLSNPTIRQGFLAGAGMGGGLVNPFEKIKTAGMALSLSKTITFTMQLEFIDRDTARGFESQVDRGIKMAPGKARCSRSGSTVEMEIEFDEQTLGMFVQMFKQRMGQNFPGF